MSSKVLLTIKETAAEYGYPTSTIYRLVASRGLAAVRETPRGNIRILRSDMEAWIATHRTPAAADAKPAARRVMADTLPGADRYAS